MRVFLPDLLRSEIPQTAMRSVVVIEVEELFQNLAFLDQGFSQMLSETLFSGFADKAFNKPILKRLPLLDTDVLYSPFLKEAFQLSTYEFWSIVSKKNLTSSICGYDFP